MDCQDALDDIDDHINGPMPNFIKRHFSADKTDTISVNDVLDSFGGRAAVPRAGSLARWFVDFACTSRPGSRGSWRVSTAEDEPTEGEAKSERIHVDFRFLNGSSDAASQDDVQVIGLVCPGGVNYRDGLLALCSSAQDAFLHQPTRLFLHGFYVRGSLAELWVFDRSGLYCSEMVDTRVNAQLFVSFLLQYERMSDEELGISSIFLLDEHGPHIILDSEDSTSAQLYLDRDPIDRRRGIVGSATTCYRARLSGSDRWTHAVKIKWHWARERPENELLELAMEKEAWGAVKLHRYSEHDSTANLRRGMRWGPQRGFLPNTTPQSGDEKFGVAHWTEETNHSFQNRTLICVVTSPLGRPLSTFETGLELLQALRDAIKCHRSLYVDARSLHGDISAGNIILVGGACGEQPKGILIDLDSTILRDEEPEDDGSIVGTRVYMAVGVLQGEAHTYRHDLESFFYVLLRAILVGRTETLPPDSRLRQWSEGRDWAQLARRKGSDMEEDGFAHILDEFPPVFGRFRTLAERLHSVLFPVRDGKLWTGTDETEEGMEALYGAMIAAFDAPIATEQ
ncbi:hypothetical protein NLG97_g5694 [Lecanicillium saksenae]|uniref:Uncharacterized protein n=1 Tax=Lecanicillium saksenae TaxID=468837 RepID=A0ACC1QVK3_9HYPO|nr:hypothetical protein NLG97_g5694 [Lecanicillium saksenae]